jgi:beta-glucosidase
MIALQSLGVARRLGLIIGSALAGIVALSKVEYPAETVAELGADAPRAEAGDMHDIATPMDYLGVNHHTRSVASADAPFDAAAAGLPVTGMGWEICPRALTTLLLRLQRDCVLAPLLMTENGAAFKDELRGGRVRDAQRTQQLQSRIAAMAQALRQGVPVAG